MRKARQREDEAVDDATLVERARAGDGSAFEALFERHWESIYRVSHRLLRDDAAAEDVTQEVFVTAYRKIAGFRGHAQFSTWLHRVAVNRALEWRRRDTRRRETSLDDAENVDLAMLAAAAPLHDMSAASASSEIETMELRESLWQAIDELPPKQRTVFLLRTGEELSFAEIASLLGKSVGGSKANFHLAVRSLRRALGGSMHGVGEYSRETRDE